MSFRRRLKNKRLPEGFDRIEEVIEDFEQQMREAVNDEHEGKRKNETTWKIHRLHWEKNRFIYDLMYVRKVMSKELVSGPHPIPIPVVSGAAAVSPLSPPFHTHRTFQPCSINLLPSPITISLPLLSLPTFLQFDFLVREKMADGALISKWRKPGYEILCSMLAIQKGNHNFGTTSHCRVPMRVRAPQQRITPDTQTGCICCASGDGRYGGPIWWNTPAEDAGESAEQNRAVWVQEGEEGDEPGPPAGEGGDGAEGEGAAGGSQKRPLEPAEDDEDELEDDVKKRLAALRGAA